MSITCSMLEQRYFDACTVQNVSPHPDIVTALYKARIRKSRHDQCSLNISLDHLKDTDVRPLRDLLLDVETSEVEAVDISSGVLCAVSSEDVLSLMRAARQKLHIVDVKDQPFGKKFVRYVGDTFSSAVFWLLSIFSPSQTCGFIFRDVSHVGLACKTLSLRFSHFKKLNMMGDFKQMHTLNLDFSAALTSFGEDCFTCMPNLMHLSLCETRITNLWTTSAALSKLHSLVELRFQKCQCCNDTGPCPKSSIRGQPNMTEFSALDSFYRSASSDGSRSFMDQFISPDDAIRDLLSSVSSETSNQDFPMQTYDSSDDSEVDFSTQQHDVRADELFIGASLWNVQDNIQNEVSSNALRHVNEASSSSAGSRSFAVSEHVLKKNFSLHPSPICFEKYYREYMIVSLAHLRVLDNILIRKSDREKSRTTFAQYFEFLPYKRNRGESIVSILQKREINTCCTPCRSSALKMLYPAKSQISYSRSLCATKVGCSAWPFMQPLSFSCSYLRDKARTFRPRQFEYHPSDSRLMVFGTLDGEIVVINHENGKVVNYITSRGSMNSVLGLSWLKSFPSKLIAGSDNGLLKLYDTGDTRLTVASGHGATKVVNFDEFDQLTSVHVNSTDELFLASGYSRNVALYDINSGKRLQVFVDMHEEHINVVKFANHSPSIFVTSSFDQYVKLWDLRQKPVQPCYAACSSRGNVMACFSPDDQYLLISAVDNEVKQLLTADGRLHMQFEIPSTGSSQNYTRSYYMNGRDYIVSGSCDEHVVRICCSQTGRRLRDISLEGIGSKTSMFVQSLRGDPFRDFNMSILAAYMRASSKSEIVKVNLLASNGCGEVYSCGQHSCLSNSLGG